MLVDYEHAIIAAKQEGKEAPASGWLRAGGFEYVDGVGLCSNNWSWTKKPKTILKLKNTNTFHHSFYTTQLGCSWPH